MEFEKLREIIGEVLSIDPETITMETKFVDDLGADSLDVFQIVLEIEQTFDISIDDSQIEQILTVGDAVSQIKKSANG